MAPASPVARPTGEQLVSINPATGERVGTVEVTPEGEVQAAVDAAAEVQPFWAQIPPAHRARYIRRTAQVILDDLDGLARLLAREQGKPRTEAYVTELLPVVDALHWIAEHGPGFVAPQRIVTPQLYFLPKRGRLVFEPLGVVGVIASWAEPLAGPLGQVAVALMCGNGVVLKPSPQTPLCGRRVGELLERAGVPEGLVQVVQGDEEVGEALAASSVAKLFFTGSVEAGRRVGAAAGGRGRAAVLELGGKDPQLVLADADVDHAVAGALWGGFAGAGQKAAAVERVFVAAEVADRFVTALVRGARELRVGDPLEWSTEIGPLISAERRDHVARLVDEAVEAGAELHGGGPLTPEGLDGAFYAPAVLTRVRPEMAIMREEALGPVLPVMSVSSEDEAVELANRSDFGLGASVWTRDRARGTRIARRLDCGVVWLNDHLATQAGMQWPWGGTKASGVGRSRGRLGFQECVDPKLVAWEPSLRRAAWWFPYDETLARAAETTAQVIYGREDDRLGALRRGSRPLGRVLRRVLGDAPPH